MAVNIDSLQIEIGADSAKAAENIKALTTALENLKAVAKGGAGLTATTNQLKRLKDVISGVDGNNAALAALSKSMQEIRNSASGTSYALNGVAKTARSSKFDYSSLSAEVRETAKQFAALPVSVQAYTNAISRAKSALNGLSGTKAAVSLDAAKVSMESLKQSISEANSTIGRLKSTFTGNKAAAEAIGTAYASLPSQIQKAISANAALELSNKKTAKSFGILGTGISSVQARFGIYAVMFNRIARIMSGWVSESNSYVENLNLFTVAMGKYAEEAQEYANAVHDALGIDPSEWMRNQGVFKQILSGFGVDEDEAYLMSKNLTQIGYDISSFFNISVEEAMQKVQSGISGELEPLRRLGYALDQATLQQISYEHGIRQSLNTMIQAEKSQLRYIAIMEQSGNVMGDMARTIQTPANAMRILNQQITQLSRAAGNLLIPALQKIIPVVQAVVEILTEAIQALAEFFGFELPKIDYSSLGGISAGANDATSALEGATAAAKELKTATIGIDELNIISPEQNTGSGGGVSGGLGGDLGLDLPEYDFLQGLSKQVKELKEKLKPILAVAGAIGAAFLAWEVAKSFLKNLDTIRSILKNLQIPAINVPVSFGLFLEAIDKIVTAAKDILKNGANFDNVVLLISGFAEGLGSAFLLFGKLKLSGVMLVITGVLDMVSDIRDMRVNGISFNGIVDLLEGLALGLSGVGLLFGRVDLAGIGFAVKGILGIVQDIKAIQEEGFTFDNTFDLIKDAFIAVGGILLVLKGKDFIGGIGAGKNISTVSTEIGDVANASGGMSSNLTSLAKNLGIGILIIAEVAAAAVIIVGAIAILGVELQKVDEAWKPVIENADTVAISIGIGTAVLVGVGLAAYALGTVGPTIAVNVGIGAAILLELGVATGLFLVEIWAIGKGLDEIGQAWEPVLNNGEQIATAIGVGTGLLVAIGVVTAALGAATVASAGLLPAAVGLGTAILAELAAAFVLFTESLVAVADELSNNLFPSLDNLNGKLPALKDDMSNFVDYMIILASDISSYTDSMGNITWSSIVSGFQNIFAGNPIQDMANNVEAIASDTTTLNEKLRIANPELEDAVELLTNYSALISQLKILTDTDGTIELSTGIFVNLQEAGKKLVTGFSNGISENSHLAYTEIETLGTTVKTKFQRSLQIGDEKSVVFIDYGRILMLSLANGISENGGLADTALKNALNPLLDRLRDFSQRFASGINQTLSNYANTMASVRGSGRNILFSSMAAADIPSFAEGGFPAHGQMFIARESGPELVGTIGNRTAVANTDQIVTAIQNGVYQAVTAAMSSQSNNNGVIQLSVNLDGQTLYKENKKIDAVQGYPIGMNPYFD